MVGGALFVAGIGASAGGLEALQALISGLRANGRVAYVVAQHMADDAHSDLVVRLLGRDSALPVMLAEDGERLRADTIRFIPAGCDGLVREGRLYLERRSVANLSAPSVNVLFASVAQACSERAIGIVLSGAGSDGTVGCRAIKARGGQTFVQSPDEARCNGMPGSAIAGRLADRVLPAADIARAVMALFQPSGPGPAATPEGTPTVSSAEREELAVLLPLVRQATGVDFTHYKEETLLRRLAKRKSDLGVVSAGAYLTLVQRRPEELQALQQFFLVSVSLLFPRPGLLRLPGPGPGRTGSRQARGGGVPGLGAGLRLRGGGLYPGHHPGRTGGAASRPPAHPRPGQRYQSVCPGDGPGRTLQAGRRTGDGDGPASALSAAPGRTLGGGWKPAGPGRLRGAGCAE